MRRRHTTRPMLTLTPPPWPQLLVVDVEGITGAEADLLGAVRAAGWPGMVIAIGEPSSALRRSLGIDRVLSRMLARDQLRNAIRHVGEGRITMPMRRLAL